MRESWHLVGRDEELDFLTQTVNSADVSGCVIAGQAGVGKTRLARELVDHARHRGREVEWFVAIQATTQITLGALAPALGTPPPQDSAGELLHWASQQFSSRDDLILCVDDAHLLDPVSASLLLQLAARRKTFVVATVRSGTQCPDSIVNLWKDGWAQRLEVVPLSRGESTLLAQDFLGGELDPDAAELLYELSAGVPLFLRELLIAGTDSGSIVTSADGRKRWQGPLVPTTRLTELVTTRLGQLPGGHREAMSLIALGEPLAVTVAERLVDNAVLADLEARALLVTDGTSARPRLRSAHPLYSEVLRETLPTIASRELHKRLVESASAALGTTASARDGAPDDDLVRIATWRLESGDLGDPALLVAAAELALRTFDTDLAERFGRAALAAGAGMRAELIVADALYYASRWGEAADVLDEITDSEADDVTRAHAAIRRASLLIWSSGDPEASQEHLAGMAGKISDPDLAAEVSAERVWALLVSNRVEEATTFAEPYVSPDYPNVRATMRALPAAIVAHAIRGTTDTAVAMAERAAAIVDSGAALVPTYQGDVLAASAFALWLDGQLGETIALVGDMADDVSADWSDGARGLLGFIRGKATFEQGHAAAAAELTRDAAAALELNDIGLFLPWAHYVLARCLALTGDIDAARKALTDGDRHRKARVGLSEPDRMLATAAIEEVTNPGDGAVLYAESAATFESWGARLYAVGALADKARSGGADADDVAAAHRLASQCHGRLGPTLAEMVHGLVSRDPHVLNDVATACESMTLDLHAAEAGFVAAAVFEDAGQRGAALSARQKATACLARCGPVNTPILRAYGGDAPLANLTKREQEIARLVATGLTNRQIADRLHVSGRTIDNHVQHIFTKLGIHSREELSSLA